MSLPLVAILECTSNRVDERMLCMSTTHLKRIYFDSNAIYRWPNPDRPVFQALNLAKWFAAEIYFPSIVEDELERQFVKNVSDHLASIRSHIRDLKTTCYITMDVDLDEPFMTVADLKAAFRRRNEDLKEYFGISSIPITTRELKLIVDMAVNRHPPFEERASGKDTVVTGLQDAAIFLSVLDHLKDTPKGERYAFVSADSVFQKSAIKELIQASGVELEIFKTPTAVLDDLWDHAWGEVATGRERESKQITELIESTKEDLAHQIIQILKLDDVPAGLFNRVVAIRSLTIETISSVYPDLPESDNLPPSSHYGRPDGSEVKITASVSVDIRATVETQTYGFFNIFAPADDDEDVPSEPPPPSPPSVSKKKYSQRLSLTLVGTAHSGVIKDLRVIEVSVPR